MVTPGARNTWYRQPVCWLGALILAATVAGCIHLIMLATRHADKPLPTAQPILFGMPTAQPLLSVPVHDSPGKAPQ